MTTPTFMPPLPSPLAEVAAASLHAAGLALAVWLVCTAAGRRLPAGWRAALWLLVFVRLALPAVPQVGWHPLAALRSDAPPTVRAIAAPRRSLPENPAAPDRTDERAEAPPGSRGFPTSPAVPAPTVTLPRFLLVAWAAGCAICLTRFGLRWRRLLSMAGRCPEVTDPAALEVWNRCRAEAGVRRGVRLHAAPPGWGAATGGCVRPTAFVSSDLLAGPSADLRTIFLHELAHVRRFDVPADRLVSLLCCAHWFNPAAWWAAARWRAARESACDDAVLARLTPADRPAYGRLVLRVSLDASSRRERAAPTFGVGFGASPLPERIAVIASHTPPTRRRRLASAAAFAALAAVGLTAAGPPDAAPDARPAEPFADPAPPPAEAAGGNAVAEEPAGVDADAVRLPCYVTGGVRDARTGEPLTNTGDGRPIRVVATAPGGFRAVGDMNEEGTFRIRVPRTRVRLTTDPPLPLVGTQDTADETDATGAIHVFTPDQVGQIATLIVLPTWPTGPEPVPEERDAVAAVKALGGSVELNDSGRVVEVTFIPKWRSGWGWSDGPNGPFENAVPFTTEADVAPLLGRFPHLREVNAQKRQITDAGLAASGPLPELRSFGLFGESSEEAFTAEGLRILFAAAPKLEYLGLEDRGPEFERVVRDARPESLTAVEFIGPPEDGSNVGYSSRRLTFPADDAAEDGGSE